MNKNQNQQSAAQRLFAQYVKYITQIVVTEYGPSYSDPKEIRNTWRYTFSYSKKIEDFLIFQTKMYIRTLDARDSNSTNPQFLRALVKLMSDYLSAYTMRSSDTMTRKKAKQVLESALYEQSAYIQNLLMRQAMARYTKRKPQKRPSVGAAKRMADTKRRFAGAKQIQIQFVETITVKKY